MGYSRHVEDWSMEMQILQTQFRGISGKSQVYRMALAVAVYQIWRERNMRRFQDIDTDTQGIIRQIQYIVFVRCFKSKISMFWSCAFFPLFLGFLSYVPRRTVNFGLFPLFRLYVV